MSHQTYEVAVVGAGIAGIATAYALCARHGLRDVVLIDPLSPMSLTSACSGENYRNWWPHPTMTVFTDDSIGMMEDIARSSGNRINMTRRGYALATRSGGGNLLEELYRGYGSTADRLVRVHADGKAGSYVPALSEDWATAQDGVDVIQDRSLIRRAFPGFAEETAMVIHIRRGGDISGQQMGQFMLEGIRECGGRVTAGKVVSIEKGTNFRLALETSDGRKEIQADILVNAAGPFAESVAAMLDISLPLSNVLQQIIAFEDREGAIPRDMPFSIDLDEQTIDWSAEEIELLRADPETAWLTETMPGAIHCRPDGGPQGRWIKLGWAYNQTSTAPERTPTLDDGFPEIVLRGAARLNPALKTYYGRLPRNMTHYGGFYTMTDENWPLIGPMGIDGAFLVGALSGFGTMAACAAGQLCAAWATGRRLPEYANSLSLARYENAALMQELSSLQSKGVL